MNKIRLVFEVIGGAVALAALYNALVPIPQYFERLNGRISQLEEQMHSLAPTAMIADRLNSRVSQLEEQMRSLTTSSGATALSDDRLNGRVSQLEERVRSLAASSAATAAVVAELSRKPAVAANPMLQKCAELAEQANTGQRSGGMGFVSGAGVTKDALALIEKLGCNSTMR